MIESGLQAGALVRIKSGYIAGAYTSLYRRDHEPSPVFITAQEGRVMLVLGTAPDPYDRMDEPWLLVIVSGEVRWVMAQKCVAV